MTRIVSSISLQMFCFYQYIFHFVSLPLIIFGFFMSSLRTSLSWPAQKAKYSLIHCCVVDSVWRKQTHCCCTEWWVVVVVAHHWQTIPGLENVRFTIIAFIFITLLICLHFSLNLIFLWDKKKAKAVKQTSRIYSHYDQLPQTELNWHRKRELRPAILLH